MPDIDALLANARSRGGGPCWRKRLTGDAVTFIEAAEAAMASGDAITHAGVSRVLTEDLGQPVARRSVSAHYSGECSCGR
ncbi:MAG TPA: hypothetical protein VM784_04145 [Actinomycetota bacterium]|jgi:hypothetical protein|nr:hypothetical protein [Actinomycetota bacterium]